jgi:hypothetical protein
MKTIIGSLIGFALALLTQQITQAQGTMTYLSNLGQPPDGSNTVASDSWLAEQFRTGTNASGYLLGSIQLGMADASGNPSGFTVMLYSASFGTGINPGSNLDTLDGSLNPAASGIYTFTTISNLMLLPNALYFIVLTAGTAVSNGAYEWSFMNTASYNPSAGWGGGVTLSSVNGSSWFRLGGNPNYDYSQFAFDAIPVPEPGVLGLFGLGGLAFLWHRRKTKAA